MRRWEKTNAMRLEELVRQIPKNEPKCIAWPFGRDGHEYGAVMVKGKMAVVHRVAWGMTFGPIPEGLACCHRCDNPPCFNPYHLFLGTQLDNIRDAISKGRFKNLPENEKGSLNGNSKLNERDIIKIREIYATGDVSQYAIAKMYGVCQGTISQILVKRIWTHV